WTLPGIWSWTRTNCAGIFPGFRTTISYVNGTPAVTETGPIVLTSIAADWPGPSFPAAAGRSPGATRSAGNAGRSGGGAGGTWFSGTGVTPGTDFPPGMPFGGAGPSVAETRTMGAGRGAGGACGFVLAITGNPVASGTGVATASRACLDGAFPGVCAITAGAS